MTTFTPITFILVVGAVLIAVYFFAYLAFNDPSDPIPFVVAAVVLVAFALPIDQETESGQYASTTGITIFADAAKRLKYYYYGSEDLKLANSN